MAPGGTFHAEGEGGGRTALPCLAEPACDTHCVQPCQMCSQAQALVEGRDPGREQKGGHCLGHNEVCINEGRREKERLNWTPASPTAPRPPVTVLSPSLRIPAVIGRVGPAENGLRAPAT